MSVTKKVPKAASRSVRTMDAKITEHCPNNDTEKLPSFPTSATVPFPIVTGPYRQQAALMDVLLQSLEMKTDFKNTSVTKTFSATTPQKRARLMMLESPTGTGKSLSIACAAIAWLRHREYVDFECLRQLVPDEPNKQDHDCNRKDVINSSDSKDNGFDWLDEWTHPSEIQQEKKDEESRKKCLNLAKDARNSLERKLNVIRKKLDVYEASRIKEDYIVRKRLAKEIVVKGGVVDAITTERTMSKRRGRVVKRQRTIINEKIKEDDLIELCIEEYVSDEDDHLITSSSDDDSVGNNRDSINISTSHETNTQYSLGDLLDGGKLDGSGISSQERRRKYHTNYNNSKNNGDSGNVLTSIGEVEPGTGVRKIIYAARTHSQLSQFVREIRRTEWGMTESTDNNTQKDKRKPIRVIALGGRALLCGNNDVVNKTRKNNDDIITEKCLDMQKGMSASSQDDITVDKTDSFKENIQKCENSNRISKKTKKISSCPLMASKEAISALSLHMLAHPSDIEDMAGMGKSSRSCAYYASREALSGAEIVVVPYNMLLSKQARRSVGLSIKQSLVIIDEAHNIPEALRSLSSCALSLPVIEGASSQLSAYIQRYASRLAGRNIFYLGQINRCLSSMKKFLMKGRNTISTECKKSLMMSTTDFLFKLKLDNINIFKVLKFLERSKLAQKLIGFINVQNEGDSSMKNRDHNQENDHFVSKHISQISFFQRFLLCLTSSQREGRVIVEWPKSENSADSHVRNLSTPSFRYMLLSPASHFDDIIKEAYSVILVGGTLRPFAHMAIELIGKDKNLIKEAQDADKLCASVGDNFTSISPFLTTFACSHVVPPSHVKTLCLSIGPSDVGLDFRYISRTSKEVCNELGKCILALCKVIPAGLIVFFPSYSYEAYVVQQWKASGIYERIDRKKKVFREPCSASASVSTLVSYSSNAYTKNGAILLSVIGGKMSEGINFANDMARGVIVVGIPYADITDPELKEKMNFMDKEYKKNAYGITGQAYYQNLCMRAVNQSIGRAIRHAKDYAAIILADMRYASDSKIWCRLPQWLRNGEKIPPQVSFSESVASLDSFFSNHQHI